jgi:predicted O-methyltransferase YrrM
MKLMIKNMARRCLSDRIVGSIDYYRFPELRLGWGGPFNGQSNRVQIFKAIMAYARPAAIIETGTYLGATTYFLAGVGLPVYSIEGNPRNYGFARARLWWKLNVKLRQGDSRAELKKLFEGPLDSLRNSPLLFYLDAHWDADLPLAEEIDIIFDRTPNAVVMIDDFEVPSDPGYGYDDYGPGKALNAEYIATLVKTYDLAVFYPSAPSHEDTGLRRGCAILCKASVLGRKFEAIELLRSS